MKTLNCDDIRPLLAAYGDGELELTQALEVERHVEGCAGCADALRHHRALSRAVRGVSYHRAPEALRAKLRAQLGGGSPAAAVPVARTRSPRAWSRWAMPMAASVALAIGLNVLLVAQQSRDQLGQQLVASHVRSLQATHLSDVVSTDQHTVKPWFAGKLDYSPPVHDLAAQDYPLIGGRLDYFAHRPVAALVYRHRQHVINLYVWPEAGGDEAPASHARDGYSLVHWRGDAMDYWAVSDLNAEELRRFAELQIVAARAPGA